MHFKYVLLFDYEVPSNPRDGLTLFEILKNNQAKCSHGVAMVFMLLTITMFLGPIILVMRGTQGLIVIDPSPNVDQTPHKLIGLLAMGYFSNKLCSLPRVIMIL